MHDIPWNRCKRTEVTKMHCSDGWSEADVAEKQRTCGLYENDSLHQQTMMEPCSASVWRVKVKVFITWLCPTPWDIAGMLPARFLCPWNSAGKNTGVGSNALLQGQQMHRLRVSSVLGNAKCVCYNYGSNILIYYWEFMRQYTLNLPNNITWYYFMRCHLFLICLNDISVNNLL